MSSAPAEVQAAIARAGVSPRRHPPARGAVDAGGRVAWTEQPKDVASLFVAEPGRPLVEVGLAVTDTLDWGYEGCFASYVEWFGDSVVVISHERGGTYVWAVRLPEGAVDRFSFREAHAVDGDLLVWQADDPHLLHAAALPSLGPRTPLTIDTPARILRLAAAPQARGWLGRVWGRSAGGELRIEAWRQEDREWVEVERLALPAGAQRDFPADASSFLDACEQRLFGAVERGLDRAPGARVIVEAAALPFCRRRPATWQPSPVWLPVYWYRHLVAGGRKAEARQFLALLDAAAAPLAGETEAEPRRGWEPSWTFTDGALHLATRHVRRVAGLQARACRDGELPQGYWCLLFDPDPLRPSGPGSRVDPATLTPVLRRLFETLAPTCPPQIPHRL